MRGGLRVDANPVRPHLRPLELSLERGHDDVGALQRHVTVHAASHQRVAPLRKEAAALHLMTGETATRELRHVALLHVHVVTGTAGHLRRPVAFAASQQAHLVAVHVHRRVVRQRRQLEVVVQRLATHIGESGRLRLAESGMALRAHLDLARAAQPRRIHDRRRTQRAKRGALRAPHARAPTA